MGFADTAARRRTMEFPLQTVPISNHTMRRRLWRMIGAGVRPDAFRKLYTTEERHCFQFWTGGRMIGTVSLKLGADAAAQLERELAEWLGRRRGR